MHPAIKQPHAKLLIKRYLHETGRKGVSSLMNDIRRYSGWKGEVFDQRTLEKWLHNPDRYMQDYNWKIILSFINSEQFEKNVPFEAIESTNSDIHLIRKTRSDMLSDIPFSEGLHQSLLSFNAELRYLTVEQVKALECALHHQHLWISGNAGTGKTIFAVEASYRALRAGLSVLIVFRTKQFLSIFSELLKPVNQKLSLLVHLDFMYLLRLLECHGADSDLFKNTSSEMLGSNPFKKTNQYVFDLVIVDDCGTYETRMPEFIEQINHIAYRKIFLAAPEQILEHFSFEKNNDDSINHSSEIYNLIPQVLHAPDTYFKITLDKNIRNSSRIVEYTHSTLGVLSKVGLLEQGSVTIQETDWQSLDNSIVTVCTELLHYFPPNRIRILVDPFIYHHDLETLSRPDDEMAYEDLMSRLPSLTRAILTAASGVSFLHSTFECEENGIHNLLSTSHQTQAYFIYTDGEEIGMVDNRQLPTHSNLDYFYAHYNQWISPHIDAKKILGNGALHDPLQPRNSILIYPVPLFIGLEADVVMYIHNHDDQVENQLSDKSQGIEVVKKARNAHHFLAMSRAKYHLVDMMIH